MKTRLSAPLAPFVAFVPAAALLAFAGCSSAPEVRVDYDRAADFTQFKTFAFASPLGTDRSGYQSLVSTYLKTAAQRELESRGLRLDKAAPQLLVNFSAELNEKLRVVTTSMPSTSMGVGVGMGVGRAGYYGYRGGLYTAWPMYRDETAVMPYQEGTLNIDVVDAAHKQLVWEGVVTGGVTQKTMDNLQPAIDAAVAAAFAKFPLAGPAKAK